MTAADAPDAVPLRVDARRNLERVKAAAVQAFRERGLGVPLEVVAQLAGVRPGTIYNRFGTRAALIDAAFADIAAERLNWALREAQAHLRPWDRFAAYVIHIGELQASDPALNDVVTRKYPEATRLTEVCDDALRHAAEFIDDAKRDGSLRDDFTAEDLFLLIWSNASVIGLIGETAPDGWRRGMSFALDGLRADAAHPLPTGPLSLDGLKNSGSG